MKPRNPNHWATSELPKDVFLLFALRMSETAFTQILVINVHPLRTHVARGGGSGTGSFEWMVKKENE